MLTGHEDLILAGLAGFALWFAWDAYKFFVRQRDFEPVLRRLSK